MSNNFTAEQIALICLGLFVVFWIMYAGIISIYQRGYQNGWAKGYTRGKVVQSERLVD
jgi:hypothetical protein